MKSLLLFTLLGQCAVCAAFFTAPIFISGPFARRANSAPSSIHMSLDEGKSMKHLQKPSMRRNAKSVAKAASIAAALGTIERRRANRDVLTRQRRAKSQARDVHVDVQVWQSEDNARCVFSFDGEAQGTVLYHLEGGYYRFQGFIYYPTSQAARGDFNSFDGTFSNGQLARPPLFVFDDPLPAMSATHLAMFARRFLKPHHVRDIKRARDILMQPLRPGEDVPQPGDRIKLSSRFCTLLEMHVTDKLTWRPTRLVSTHKTNHRDRSGHSRLNVIDWDLYCPGADFEDAVVQRSGVVLTPRKLSQLLELQMGMIDKELNSELILHGIAASYNGQGGTFNSFALQLQICLRRFCLDHLATFAGTIHRFLSAQSGWWRSIVVPLPCVSTSSFPERAEKTTWRQRR